MTDAGTATDLITLWAVIVIVLLVLVLIVSSIVALVNRLTRLWRRPRRRVGLYGSPEIPVPRDPKRRR